jgi:CRISPR-associated protein Cas2
MAARKRFLVCYDIRDDRRLRRVHKTMKSFGWSMQYSVFVCDLSAMEVFALRTAVGEIIDHECDSVALIDCGDPADRGRACFSFLGPLPSLPVAGPVVL